eukprot:scaffold3218_cov350-Prasinococcus_capsulatus_cf.AAC.6
MSLKSCSLSRNSPFAAALLTTSESLGKAATLITGALGRAGCLRRPAGALSSSAGLDGASSSSTCEARQRVSWRD